MLFRFDGEELRAVLGPRRVSSLIEGTGLVPATEPEVRHHLSLSGVRERLAGGAPREAARLSPVLLALVVWRCPLDAKERDRLITIFVAVAFITALFGLYQQRVGHVVLNSWGYPYNEVIRFTSGFRLRSFSTFNQPFPFAFYLMLTVLLALPQAIADPHRLRNRLFLLSTPVLGRSEEHTSELQSH